MAFSNRSNYSLGDFISPELKRRIDAKAGGVASVKPSWARTVSARPMGPPMGPPMGQRMGPPMGQRMGQPTKAQWPIPSMGHPNMLETLGRMYGGIMSDKFVDEVHRGEEGRIIQV
jgi:hypothetical protein